MIAPADQVDRIPGYDVVRRAARVSKVLRVNGHFVVTQQEFVLLGLRE